MCGRSVTRSRIELPGPWYLRDRSVATRVFLHADAVGLLFARFRGDHRRTNGHTALAQENTVIANVSIGEPLGYECVRQARPLQAAGTGESIALRVVSAKRPVPADEKSCLHFALCGARPRC